MNYFSDLEGLRLAVAIEKRGAEFYMQAQDNANDPRHKALFAFLLQEELNHAAKFETLYDELKHTKNAGDDQYLFDADVSRYLQALVETQVFPRHGPQPAEPKLAHGVLETGWQHQTPGQPTAGGHTVKSILQLALQAEKDSILFYDQMMANAKFPEAKTLFAKLKAEEQVHVEKIQDLLRTL